MAISLSAATTWACAGCRERFRPSGPRAGRVRRVGRSPDGAFHFSSLQWRLRRDPPPRDPTDVSTGGAVMEVDGAVAESAFLQQLEVEAGTIGGKGALAASDQDRHEEELV